MSFDLPDGTNFNSSDSIEFWDKSGTNPQKAEMSTKDIIIRNVENISDLRNVSTNGIRAARVTDDTQGGVFIPKQNDPFGNGDDGATALQAGDGTWWVRQAALEGPIRGRWFGIDGSGTDRTSELSSMLSFGGREYVLDANGTLRVGNVTVPDGATFRITGGTTVKEAVDGTSSPLIELGEGASLINGSFEGSADGSTPLIKGQNDDVEIRGCEIVDAPEKAVQVNNNARSKISGLTIKNPGSDAIYAAFCSDVHVLNCYVEDARHAVYFWGGDSGSSTTVDGQRGEVSNVDAVRCATGFFSSLWAEVTVTGMTVYDVEDVGIDFEGGRHLTATGNVVKEAKNAGISVFNGTSQVSIVGNTIENDGSVYTTGDLFGISFYGQNGTHTRVTVTGNTIYNNQTQSIKSSEGQIDDSTISNNEIEHDSNGPAVWINEGERVAIKGNQIRTGSGPDGVRLQNCNECLVFGNFIEGLNDNSSIGDGAGIMNLTTKTGNFGRRNRIKGNYCKGYVTGVMDDNGVNNDTYILVSENTIQGALARSVSVANQVQRNNVERDPANSKSWTTA